MSGLNASLEIVPGNVPNDGILFVNHEAQGRSGHGGNTITECTNGDIVSFYSNVSGELYGGHGVAGWSEYRRSTDGGQTWSEPYVFPYSQEVWEGDELYSAIVVSATAAPNGTLVAVAGRFANERWQKALPPVYFLSHDHGETWSQPRDVDPDAGVDQLSLTYDATFVHDGTVYVVFIGGSESMCEGPLSLYASTDNGETFARRSMLPFNPEDMYTTASVLDDGRIIVYAYPWRGWNGYGTNEHNLPYVTSKDGGRTWSHIENTYFSRRLRNPQLSRKIGDHYFIHGRSGSKGNEPNNLVLYSSSDGINWDGGTFLNTSGGTDSYSANEIIGKYDPQTPNRLLIQSSINYDGRRKVNIRQWWLEKVGGT